MLIFGDVSTNKVNPDHEIKIVEIIYLDLEELEFIINLYNLKHLTYNSIYHQEYTQGKIKYRLFASATALILRKLLKDSFAYKYKQTIAGPFHNFILDSIKVLNYHAKLDEWFSRVQSYTFLADNYVKDILNYDNKFERILEKYHKMLTKLVDAQPNISRRPYPYHPFTIMSRNELLSIVTTTMVNSSPLHRITDNFTKGENDLLEARFDGLPYQQQVTAAIESLYIDVLNEFVLPYISDTKNQPSEEEVERAYLRCIMYRATQTTTGWLGHFMLDNITEVMSDYDVGFYNVFKNVLKSGKSVVV